MVKLKTDATIAVAAFFGHEESNSNIKTSEITVPFTTHHEAIDTLTTTHGKGGNKKLGVGAAPKVDNTDKAIDNAAKLLKIGKGRNKRISNQGEEEVDVIIGHQSESSDDEEDGRTAVGKSKSAAKADLMIDVQLKRKKSKKKKANSCSESSIPATKDECKHDNTGSTSANPCQIEGLESLDAYRKQRLQPSASGPDGSGKRTKVRSKQKNIRRDTRGYKKPRHLIPGDSEFSGRGLTAATRAYLGLPEKQNTVAIRQSSSTNTGGFFPSEDSYVVSDLAVDSLLADVGQLEADDGNIAPIPNTSRKSMKSKSRSLPKEDNVRKKSKKPKYKNLRILL